MGLNYGGIRLDILDTREISRQRIASDDGTTYLWTRWVFDVHAIVNPATISWGGVPGAPVAQNGIMPAVTDLNIRRTLRTDRSQLTYKLGEDIILQSPPSNEVVDANYGPVVEACDIIQVFADRSILVHFRVVTCVNDCGQTFTGGNGTPYGASSNPLISLRWDRHVDTDDAYDSTMVTEGLATFNLATLKRLGHYPDQYRRDLIIPPPANCRRISIQVAATSDGTGIRFRAVDKQTSFNLGSTCDAVKLECYHTAWFNRTGGAAAAAGFGLGALSTALSLVPGIGGLLSAGASRITPAAPTGSVVPTYHESVLARAWGNRDSSRAQLTRIALGVAMWRLRSITASHVYELQVQQDVFGKFVEVNMSKASGIETAPPTAYPSFGIEPDGTVYPNLVLPVGSNQMLIAFAETANTGPGEEHDFVSSAPGFTSWKVSQDRAVGNPGPPFSNSTRGTLLEDVVAQVLANGCDLGAGSRPANTPFATERFVAFPPSP